MRGLPVLLLLVLLFPALAGCLGGRGGPVEREDLGFPVASRVGGVEASPQGEVNLTGADGVLVTPSQEEGTVRVGLAAVVQTNVFHACGETCRNLTVAPGTLIAEGGLISLRNLSLNAAGPDRDAAIFFHDGGLETGRFLRWYEQGGKFQLNGDLQTIGNVTGTGYVGTVTPLIVGQQGQLVTVSTAATETTEVTVFARGSGRLTNGTATIAMDPAFVAIAGEGLVTVQVTLTSPAPGIWVTQKDKEHIVVESVAGTFASFDWLVQAPRKGGEQFVV
jgi:predicted small lipoprotein YifL